ncbi:putative lipase atg15 [Paramarasmius palmivorus]|uniref:triacylglycerol lipase n=1 Tax=Paramarasmius palmivorus TaxID=297713 RepID=A0AAW0BZ38_9AGAR
MLPATLTSLLVPLVNWATQLNHNDLSTSLSQPKLNFELRHHHAVSDFGRVVFSDVSQSSLMHERSNAFSVSTRPTRTHRPPSFDSLIHAVKRRSYVDWDWEEDEVPGPDVEKRETLLTLAKMTNNAYFEDLDSGGKEWYDLGPDWPNTHPFGWEPEADGFRGQVFATPDNSTVIISIKGTSAGLFGGGGPTAKKDKLNDNLLFSCCCARVDWTWTTVCGCYRGGWKCDQDCLEDALIEDTLFYPIGTNLYNNLTYMYPTSNIWIIGHSLGGALASLLGATFGAPVVTIESPGEKMAAGRLHLPSPPSTHHITHVYHTADPIPMGTCNGVLSSCALGGYAMESR